MPNGFKATQDKAKNKADIKMAKIEAKANPTLKDIYELLKMIYEAVKK